MNKKTILIIVLSVLVILVNSFTAVVLYKKLSADHKSADSHINDTEADADVTDENKEVSYYGKPSQIIVFGNGKEYSIDSSDAYYQEILEYNETAMRSAPTLAGHEFYDYKNLKAYGLRYIYDEDFVFTPKNYTTFNVKEIVFILTGEHHGTVCFNLEKSPIVLGGLATQPEFNEMITDILN